MRRTKLNTLSTALSAHDFSLLKFSVHQSLTVFHRAVILSTKGFAIFCKTPGSLSNNEEIASIVEPTDSPIRLQTALIGDRTASIVALNPFDTELTIPDNTFQALSTACESRLMIASASALSGLRKKLTIFPSADSTAFMAEAMRFLSLSHSLVSQSHASETRPLILSTIQSNALTAASLTRPAAVFTPSMLGSNS